MVLQNPNKWQCVNHWQPNMDKGRWGVDHESWCQLRVCHHHIPTGIFYLESMMYVVFFFLFFFFWGLLRIHPCDACLNWILSFSPQTLFISTNPREGFCVCFSWKLKIGDIFLENGSCISLSPTFHMFLCTSLWINVTVFHHQLKFQLYEKKIW